MRAPAILAALTITLCATRASADSDDLASIAAGICRGRPAGVAEAENAASQAEAARKLAQSAYDQAADAAKAAAKDAAADKASKEKQAAAKAADQEVKDQQAKLAKATQLAKDKSAALPGKLKLRAELCGTDWSRYEGKHFPRRFLLKFAPNVCTHVAALGSNDDKATADELCRGSSMRSSTGFGNVAVNLVLGLGDLLQAEAKQEVLEYLLEHVAKKFCEYKKGDIDLGKWFTNTCKKLFPPEAKGEVDASAFNFGELKDAFKEDLKALPGNVGPVLHAWIKKKWPNADPYIAVAGALFLIAFDLSQHKKPGEIFEHLGTTADDLSKNVLCDFTSPDDPEQKRLRKACAALLLFQLARTGAQAYAVNESPRLSIVIEDALVAFCTVHGVDGKKDNGDCVIDPTHYEEWHTRLLAFWRAVKQMIDLQRSLDTAAKVALPGELGKRSGPEVVKALRELVNSFSEIIENVSPAEASRIAEDSALINLGLDVYEAIVGDDPAALRKGLLGILKSPFVADKVSAKTARAITIVVSLGTAKDRGEVKAILADVVDPVGTYKSKYGADHVVIAVNGFVGFFAGGELRTHVHSADGMLQDPARKYAPFKLATPIGIDFTLKSWTKTHLGVFVSAIDPLALDVSDDNGSLHADWATLFVPGAYFRVGKCRSPFSLAIGANYTIGRRSTETCGSDRCFDGAFQFGAFLSADVPLLSVR